MDLINILRAVHGNVRKNVHKYVHTISFHDAPLKTQIKAGNFQFVLSEAVKSHEFMSISMT